MTLLVNLIGFLVFFYIFSYLPGLLILKKLKIKSFWDLDLAVGITLLGSTLFFGRWLLPTNYILSIIFLILISYLFLNYKQLNLTIPKIKLNYKLLLVLLLGVTAQSLPYITSLIKGESYLSSYIFSNHDQAWHASLIYELVNHFPPQIPGFSGVTLKNYHYLYDLILAANLSFLRLNLNYLLQGIYPIAISFLFGTTIYRVTTLLTKSKLTPILAVFFGYFANNLSFLQQFIGKNDWQISDLIIDQPIIYLFNHQTVLSISLVTYLAILITKVNSKKLEFNKSLIISLSITSLILLKIYAFITIIFALAIYWLLNIKNKNILLILSISGLISLVYLGLTFNLGGKFLNFNPGWIAEAFFDKTLAPIFPKLHGLQMIWHQQGNNLKLTLLKLFSLTLLLISNFHLRLLGFFSLFKRPKPIVKILTLTSLTSIILSLIGNQVSSAYNIIQFLPYALTLSTILSLLFLEKLTFFVKYLILFLFIITSLPSIKTIQGYLRPQDNYLIYQEKIDLLKTLSTKPQGTIVSFVEENSENNLLSSASQQRSFYADQKQLIVLGQKYAQRQKIIKQLDKDFSKLTIEDKTIINAYNLKYFLTPAKACDLGNKLLTAKCIDPSFTLLNTMKGLSLYEYYQ